VREAGPALFGQGFCVHNVAMTKLLDMAIEAAKDLPAELQDEVAGILLSFIDRDQEVYQLTPEEEDSLAVSLAQAKNRNFVPEDEVEALFAKWRS
jgi:hypothetical protein